MRTARADAYLVEPRVVRRMIRELYGFARLSTRIPHTESLVARAEDIRMVAHPDELGLEDFGQLSDLSILVAQPEDSELDNNAVQDLLQIVWGRLFHSCIDLQLRRQLDSRQLSRDVIQDCIDRVGQVEFDEAHAVLRSELRLLNPDSHIEAYCEFVATYLQLSKFSPDLLPVWFPSLEETPGVLSVLTTHIDVDKLFAETRLYGATEPDLSTAAMRDELRMASERQSWSEGISLKPSEARYTRLLRKRAKWAERGNTVSAGVSAMRAYESATTEDGKQLALGLAREDIAAMADRLRAALNFREADVEDWRRSLWALLENSTIGFWSSDKKLLYDLQKVCLDHERTVYQVDLVKWIVSRGKRPLRRPLNNLREVMMAKHLASSASRLVYVRLSGLERERLSRLLHAAAELAEVQMRTRMRAPLRQSILDVGLNPGSVPEQVAFDKMVEESLDCITQRGYLTMGYLRDAISRNDLKLPDLTGPRDLIRGDHLLRTDDRLDVSLDGVYRRGEFYLRWLQVVSSLAFGTRTGRFVTLFIAIPFGGGLVIVVGVHHLIAVFTGSSHHAPVAATDAQAVEPGVEPLSGSEQTTETASSGTIDSAVEAPGERNADTANGSDIEAATALTDDEKTIVDDDAAAASAVSEDRDSDSDPPEALTISAEDSAAATTETVLEEPHPLYTWVGEQTVSLTLVVGFLLMALIHLPNFRSTFLNVLRYVWNGVRTVIYDVPLKLLRLPVIQRLWRSRWFTRLRRNVTNPLLLAWLGCRVIPWVFGRVQQPWWMVAVVGVLFSFAVNSRLGRDAEELAGEWLANAWHDLRSRFLMALFEWTLDFFKWLLNLLERFIYAVDEWLRFHSGETWVTLVAKAILGVLWSFVSFLIRIYVNLLIEPTLHPVKHFPIVTVAHKIMLPIIPMIETNMRNALTPYLGLALAGPITWFNIVFMPGIFGFLVWELKENWRLYASNRVRRLHPVVIGSHGENGGRLLKPGFHSGTLPKLFGRLRRLEQKEPSFHRFSERRAHRESLEHVERDIRRFVERDLIRLLRSCTVWQGADVVCLRVHAASNSFRVELGCDQIDGDSVHLLFQEQSGWLVATVARHGWLDRTTPEQLHSFETALRGFYCKAGVDLVREQMERQLIGPHPYDVCFAGLAIWPERRFDRQIICDLHRRHQIRPTPLGLAASYGLQPVSREAVVFSESEVPWAEWQQLWTSTDPGQPTEDLPLACLQSARASLIKSVRS